MFFVLVGISFTLEVVIHFLFIVCVVAVLELLVVVQVGSGGSQEQEDEEHDQEQDDDHDHCVILVAALVLVPQPEYFELRVRICWTLHCKYPLSIIIFHHLKVEACLVAALVQPYYSILTDIQYKVANIEQPVVLCHIVSPH